jgi:hypothetical protein
MLALFAHPAGEHQRMDEMLSSSASPLILRTTPRMTRPRQVRIVFSAG